MSSSLSFKGTFQGDLNAIDIPNGIYEINGGSGIQNYPSGKLSGYSVFIQLEYFDTQIFIASDGIVFRGRTGAPPQWNPYRTVQYT